MKLRTEDQLGYFSTQMLGQLALPSVTVEAQRVVMQGRRSGMSSRPIRAELFDVDRRLEEPVGYVAHVDRDSGAVRVVAGPGEELPGESLTAGLYRAAATMGEHRFTLGDVHTYRSLEEMNAALSGAVAVRRCACSRVVPLSEWDNLYDCCSDCANDAANAGDNWREYFAEQERLRLLGEFYD